MRGGAALIVIIAAAGIVSTHRVFSHTYDEAYHLAAGIEWLQRGKYELDIFHPPLARVAAAVAPFVDGARVQQHADLFTTAHSTLYARPGKYLRTLALARIGILPFFLLAAWATYAWSRRAFGEVPGLVAVALLTGTPAILAHAGLVTTDMALAGTLTATLYAFSLWLDRPRIGRSLALGIAAGFSLIAKMSAILFLPVAGSMVLLTHLLSARRSAARATLVEDARGWSLPRGLWASAIATMAAALVLWAGYRFSFHLAKQWGGGGIPIFAGEYIHGLLALVNHNRGGQFAYLFDELGHGGRWYFFPVVIAVKTPIPLLILFGAGVLACANRARGSGDWRVLAPFLAAVAIVGATMPANINAGVRHVLPIYPLLAITAAAGAVAMWRSRRMTAVSRAVLVSLFAWLSVATIRAHPDHLAYFNEFAGSRPEYIFVDSDLDWGQDLLRLEDTLRSRGIDSVAIAYYGSAELHRHDISTGVIQGTFLLALDTWRTPHLRQANALAMLRVLTANLSLRVERP